LADRYPTEMRSPEMSDSRGELGDFICRVLHACKNGERGLKMRAKERGIPYESLVAAALTSAILEKWVVTPIAETS
jgi:hypothetical protein